MTRSGRKLPVWFGPLRERKLPLASPAFREHYDPSQTLGADKGAIDSNRSEGLMSALRWRGVRSDDGSGCLGREQLPACNLRDGVVRTPPLVIS